MKDKLIKSLLYAYIFTFVLFFPPFLANAQEPVSARIDFIYEQAVVSFTKQDYDVAQQLFKEILDLDPTHREARDYLQNRIPAELEIIKREKIKPLQREAFKTFKNKEYEISREYFLKILEIDPEHQKAAQYANDIIPKLITEGKIKSLYRNAIQSYKEKDSETASQFFEEILTLDPEQKKARVYLDKYIPRQVRVVQKNKIKSLYRQAFNLYYQRKYDEARQMFLKVLELDPEKKEAKFYAYEKIPFVSTRLKIKSLYEEALGAYADKDYERASVIFKEILELEPQHPEASVYLTKRIPRMVRRLTHEKIALLEKEAQKLYYRKKYEESKDLFEQILTVDPDNRKARLYLEKKLPDKFIAMKKGEIRTLSKEAFRSFYKKRYREAQELFLQIIELDPEHARARRYAQGIIPRLINKDKIKSLYIEGVRAFRDGRYEEANDLFEKILQLDPYHNKAKLYVNKKLPRKLGMDKDKKIRGLYRDALAQLSAKNYEAANKIFKEILYLDPTERKARYYLTEKMPSLLGEDRIKVLYDEAYRLYDIQDYEGARQVFKEILAIDPGQKTARTYLAKEIPAERVERKGRIDLLYDDALAYFDEGRYRRAEAVFKEILALDPTQDKARTYIEAIIPDKLAVTAAVPPAVRAIEAYPRAARRPEVSPKLYIAPCPEVGPARLPGELARPTAKGIGFLYDQAFAYYNRREYTNAHNYFEKILALDPEQGVARTYLGLIKERAALEREQ
ncbi:MAG: tetratricopeptide repeat protein [Candidatus Omnitrophota bacterium]|nr:MAG: tetratricopeptide repeat protein [Candidatus Omnitrophota bacterium]